MEDRDLLLQLLEAPLQHLAPANLIGQQTLDPPQRLDDRIILLLQTIQSPIDLIEMTKDFPEFLVDGVEPLVDRIEAVVDSEEPLIDGVP